MREFGAILFCYGICALRTARDGAFEANPYKEVTPIEAQSLSSDSSIGQMKCTTRLVPSSTHSLFLLDEILLEVQPPLQLLLDLCFAPLLLLSFDYHFRQRPVGQHPVLGLSLQRAPHHLGPRPDHPILELLPNHLLWNVLNVD